MTPRVFAQELDHLFDCVLHPFVGRNQVGIVVRQAHRARQPAAGPQFEKQRPAPHKRFMVRAKGSEAPDTPQELRQQLAFAPHPFQERHGAFRNRTARTRRFRQPGQPRRLSGLARSVFHGSLTRGGRHPNHDFTRYRRIIRIISSPRKKARILLPVTDDSPTRLR